jgi:hypothetical protein
MRPVDKVKDVNPQSAAGVFQGLDDMPPAPSNLWTDGGGTEEGKRRETTG